jgi:2-iminobutanoate/2-iminopropanoate deaminase
MKFIQTQKAPSAIGPYSQATVVNGMVYTSGQIALLPDGSDELLSQDVTTQTKQVLTNLREVLEAAGSSLNNVVKTTIFIADMDDFATINEIYESFFNTHKPARSTVAVKTLPKSALVEIDAIAII